jgi:galactose mutarotase-like enzyme
MTKETRTLHIASSDLSADVSTLGAELQNLCDADGRSLQWDGDPAIWTGRAPLLFPIVGMLAGGRYRLGAREYTMSKHGFARQASFEVVSHAADAVTMRLVANDETRAAYPFEFQLDVAFTIADAQLRIVARISNRGTDPMPASFGFHPALRWPLPYGAPRADHFIRFERDEPADVRRIDGGGLLLQQSQPTPVVGDVLALRDELFANDALIFDRLASRKVSYGATSGPQIEMHFEDFPMLGVWTKPGGAGFICIEPWQGCADPIGFKGEIWDKPGIVAIQAGQSRAFAMTIALRDQPGR